MEYNGIILLNKPQGPTSHDMIYQMRRIFGTKKVGHTGTLDPLATGVLPICIGNATKASDMLLAEKKEYVAQLVFGLSTDTGDITGTVTEKSSFIPTEEEIKATLGGFVGEIMQTPPMYSAKKQGGKKLYELAREGQVVERKAVPITVYEAEFLGKGASENSYSIRFLCSKGTYIRVLCEDIGKKLGTLAVMSSLCRTSSGSFRIENSYTIEDLMAMNESELNEAFIKTEDLFDFKKIYLSAKQSDRMKNGVFVSHPEISDGNQYSVYDSEGVFFAVAECIEGRLRIKKSFRS